MPNADRARLEMVHDLHQAVFLASWARPETPQQVWTMLLGLVVDLRLAVEQATCAITHGGKAAIGNWPAVEPCRACKAQVDDLLRRRSRVHLEAS